MRIFQIGALALLAATFLWLPSSTSGAQPSVEAGLDQTLARFSDMHGDRWSMTLDARHRFVRRMWGQGISVDLMPDAAPAEVGRACLDLLNEWGALWGAVGVELGEPRVTRALDLWFVDFPQRLRGVPVPGARIFFRVHSSGSVVLIGSDLIPGLAIEPGLKEDESGVELAVEIARDESGASLDSADASLVAWPDWAAGTARWAWRIEAPAGSRTSRPLVYVDAADYRILGSRDLLNRAAISGAVTGQVHPLYEDDTLVSEPLPELRVTVTGYGFDITDQDGEYSIEAGTGTKTVWCELDGPFINVYLPASSDSRITTSGTAGNTVNMIWSNLNSTAAERDIFHHMGIARAYMKDLDSGFTGLDTVLPAEANAVGSCDASWDGAAFHFTAAGGSCGNMGSFADVIYHEYGHAVTEKVGGAPDAFPAAMIEAFSDYFACTITDDPEFGEYVGGTSDPIRDIDLPDLATPDDLTGDAEHDGMILSGAIWDARANLVDLLGPVAGTSLADDLFHFSRYGLAQTFDDYFMDLWALDDDNGDLSDGTPHAYYIVEAFNRHGMGPDVGIDIESVAIAEDDNSNGTAEPGETIELVPTVRSLYKGTDSLELILLSDSEYVTILEPTVTFPYVEPWSDATASSGWTVEIDQETPFGTQVPFNISIVADEGEYSEAEPWALTVGAFQVLLVDDDGGQEIVDAYLAQALLASGYTFTTWNVAGVGQSPRPSDMSPFPVVVWNTADQQTDTLTSEDQEALAGYLDGGGSLLLIGQDIMDEIGAEPFSQNYLHVAGFTLNRGVTVLFPPESEPISEGMYFDTFIPIFPDRADDLTASANASGVLMNQDSAPVLLKYPQVGEAEYRLLFMSFSYEALPIEGTEPSTGPVLLNRCLNWLLPMQILLTDPYHGETGVPINADVVIRFSKPVETSTLELMVVPDMGEFVPQWSPDSMEVTLSHETPFPAEGAEIMFQVVRADDAFGNTLVRGDVENPFKFYTAGPPAPSEMVPDRGPSDEPVPVLIKGGAFLETPGLMLGDTPLEEVTFRSPDVLTALVPSGMEEGTYDLTVTNPDDQQAILENAYTVGAPGEEGDDDDDDDSCGCGMSPSQREPISSIIVVLFSALGWAGLRRARASAPRGR